MILSYRYNTLDKLHEYQIFNEKDTYYQWIWFYLGKGIKLQKREIILPYIYDQTENLLEGIDKEYFTAQQIAKIIIRTIRNHRRIRKGQYHA